MKAIAFANRLARDIDEKSVVDLTADVRLELVDAINGGIQTMHMVGPYESKTTTGSIALAAPVTVSIGVTNGSAEVTGHTFTAGQIYNTIRVEGDGIDNQVADANELLHPYSGTTGTVSATIYADGVAIGEPYDELVGDPLILETSRLLTHHKINSVSWHHKQVAEPRYYWLEANARNQNPPANSVIRFDHLPDRAYRIQAQFTLAPVRITFADLLASGATLPIRAEHVEQYLLPIARGILTSSRLWRDPSTKQQARADAALAERKYETLVPRTLATPRNRIRTKAGY